MLAVERYRSQLFFFQRIYNVGRVHNRLCQYFTGHDCHGGTASAIPMSKVGSVFQLSDIGLHFLGKSDFPAPLIFHFEPLKFRKDFVHPFLKRIE